MDFYKILKVFGFTKKYYYLSEFQFLRFKQIDGSRNLIKYEWKFVSPKKLDPQSLIGELNKFLSGDEVEILKLQVLKKTEFDSLVDVIKVTLKS